MYSQAQDGPQCANLETNPESLKKKKKFIPKLKLESAMLRLLTRREVKRSDEMNVRDFLNRKGR